MNPHQTTDFVAGKGALIVLGLFTAGCTIFYLGLPIAALLIVSIGMFLAIWEIPIRLMELNVNEQA